jgi:hypothetical protein
VPTSIYTPEIATTYGALDSAAVADGAALTAHVVRALSRGANRLLAKAETPLSACYPVRGGDLEAYAPTGRAYPFWIRVESWPIRTQADRRALDVRLTMRAASGEVLEVQLCTAASPFSPAPAAGAYKTLTGTGSWGVLEWDALPCAGGEDEVTLYLRGTLGSVLGNTAVYGSPNTGTVQEVTADGIVRTSASTTWQNTSTLATWAWSHVLVFLSGSTLLTDPRLITGVAGTTPQGRLSIYPPIGTAEAAGLRLSTYEIRECGLWRLASIHAITTPRTSL